MASPSHFSLSLSLDSSLKPFLSSLSHYSLHCSPAPLTHCRTTTFLSPLSLSNFSQLHHFPHGTLLIHPMFDTEIDAVSRLLSESFIKTLLLPPNYVDLLAFRQELLGRYESLAAHTALLVGIYSHDEAEEPDAVELACTAEISFNERGANAAPPTPVPPRDCPYICNMTVKNSLRRKGIGKELIQQMQGKGVQTY